MSSTTFAITRFQRTSSALVGLRLKTAKGTSPAKRSQQISLRKYAFLLSHSNRLLAFFDNSCSHVMIIVGCTPYSEDSSASVFAAANAAIATSAMICALGCLRFGPMVHALSTGQL